MNGSQRFFLFSSLVLALAPLHAEQAKPPDAAAAAHAISERKALAKANETSAALLSRSDFDGLEALVERCRAAGSVLTDTYPPLHEFYRGLVVYHDKPEQEFLAQKVLLEEWLKAKPGSIAAKLTLMKWWNEYAWRGRGRGYSHTVDEEGWELYRERLAEVRKIVDGVDLNQVNDAVFFAFLIVHERYEGNGPKASRKSFERGLKVNKDYIELYTKLAFTLTRKWGGPEGGIIALAEEMHERVAAERPGEADYLYAMIACENYNDSEPVVFSKPEYERIRAGLKYGIASGDRCVYECRDRLALTATKNGDYKTAIATFLEIGKGFRSADFGSWSEFLEVRKASGADRVIEEVINLEREGKLEEAEERYRSFSTGPKSDWLEGFYLRQGLEEEYYKVGGKKFGDPKTVSLNEAHEICWKAPLFDRWEEAQAAAERFDEARPWNLSGRAIRFFIAARRGDRAAGEELKESLLANTTNREAIINLQAILRGEKTWRESAHKFRKEDGYNFHAAMTLAGYYLSQGEREQARGVIEDMAPYVTRTTLYEGFLRSTLHGSLARQGVLNWGPEKAAGGQPAEGNRSQRLAIPKQPGTSPEAKAEAELIAESKTSLDLLKAKNFAGLEALAERLREAPTNVFNEWPPLRRFYSGLDLEKKETDEAWQARFALLEEWRAAYPNSITPRIALLDWWIGYAWKARGSGYSYTVTDEGRKLFRERLDHARKIVDETDEAIIDDPAFYSLVTVLNMGQGKGVRSARRDFEKGMAIDLRYIPLYKNFANYLSPKWRGEEGDIMALATEIHPRFENREEADFVYAVIAGTVINSGGSPIIAKSQYERVKRALQSQLDRLPLRSRYGLQNRLCYFASIHDDDATAAPLFLTLGRNFDTDYFKDRATFEKMRAASAASRSIEEALNLEREGKLEEAEKRYAGFVGEDPYSPWLRDFYLRQGMEEKYYALGRDQRIDPKEPDLGTIFRLCYLAPIFGNWEVAEEVATRFDAARPWNLSGRAILFLVAARKGDPAEGERLKQSLLENKTDRPAIKNLQAILRGETTWQESAHLFYKEDGFNFQAVLTLVGYYLSQGEREKAREVMEAMEPYHTGMVDLAAFLQSTLYGSLHRQGFFE